MNKMYTLGTHIEVVTDHAAVLPAYNAPNKPKQLRVDRHCTKLLPFRYNVVYEPGKITPCDYGLRYPPPNTDLLKKKELTGLLRMKQTFSSTGSYRINSLKPSL